MTGRVGDALLDTGEWPRWSPAKRAELGRCLSCEFHPATQGHHPYCPKETS